MRPLPVVLLVTMPEMTPVPASAAARRCEVTETKSAHSAACAMRMTGNETRRTERLFRIMVGRGLKGRRSQTGGLWGPAGGNELENGRLESQREISRGQIGRLRCWHDGRWTWVPAVLNPTEA